MRFEVSSSDLLKKLQLSGSVISPNSVNPITEDYLFILSKGELTVLATNTETTIITKLPVVSSDEGKVAIQGKILLETLKALPEQPIAISVDSNTNAVEITSSYGKYNLAGDNPEEFPTPPQEDNTESFELDSFKLSKAINKTSFATSNDDMRTAMMGVLMHIDYNKLIFVATDAHKLIKYTFGNINTDISTSVILPKKAVVILKNALPLDKKVKISFNDSNAFFSFEDTVLICRLIDAKYPDYNAVIPVNNELELTLNRKDFQSSLRRIGIYSSKSTNQVLLNISENSMTLSAQDLDFSNEATEQLPCKWSGTDPITVGYNSKFLIEMLGYIDSDEIIIQLSTPNRAGLMIPTEQDPDENITMLVMPVFSSY